MSPDQVGTVEFGLHANLSLKSCQRLVGDPMQWQHFDRTLSAHDFMDRFEDLPHTSLADEVGNHIRPKSKFDLPIRELICLILGDARCSIRMLRRILSSSTVSPLDWVLRIWCLSNLRQ
jgi:hypothetical protein